MVFTGHCYDAVSEYPNDGRGQNLSLHVSILNCENPRCCDSSLPCLASSICRVTVTKSFLLSQRKMGPMFMGHLFQKRALESPDAAALIFYRSDVSCEGQCRRQVLSFWELLDMAHRVQERVESRLSQLSMIDDSPVVALCIERSPLAVAAILGICLAGCPWLPLDPQHPSARSVLSHTRSSLTFKMIFTGSSR